ncbi:hypothetical protein AVEN_239518-1 [Araneus ventricosus]|uniref:Uncharacterized protein n=1 Tax=Araneus ventricosus TaxID=182803 RepID=A0A4Y2T8B3_ARAVE|nr:hypothetical protein AVEN_239518-1 [Araneus ventricosus]
MFPLQHPRRHTNHCKKIHLRISENIESEDFPTLIESSEPGRSKLVIRKDFITPKLVVALDKCQLSMRDSVFILEATIDELGCNIDEFPISKS